ncbi:unnamed protein product [Sphagnum compactum]
MCSVGQSTVSAQCLKTLLPGGAFLPPAAFKVSTKPCCMKLVKEQYVGQSFLASKGLRQRIESLDHDQKRRLQPCYAQLGGTDTPEISITSNGQSFVTNGDTEEGFFVRLKRAWQVLFPSKTKSSSNAEVAKQRLKMILISDRCSVNDEAKRKIVNNIVGALSDFVEIESEEKVQLNVSSDLKLGTVYSVTVPVRRVKPEYQSYSNELVNKEFMTVDYLDDDSHFKMLGIHLDSPDHSNE